MGDELNATNGPHGPVEPGYGRLARDPERRAVSGVCTGLGRYTGIDPVVYRVGFGLLVLAHGMGIILYIAAALLMPPHPGASSRIETLFRRWFDARAVLAILGGMLFLGVLGNLYGNVSTDTVTAVVVFGMVLLVSHARGVDLFGVVRSVPELLAGHPPAPPAHSGTAAAAGPVSLDKDLSPGTGGGLPEGMIDLAAYGSRPSAGTLPHSPATAMPGAPYPGTGGGPKRRSPAASITLLAAMAAGAAMIPAARTHPAPDSGMLVIATALAVVGVGLIAGGWLRTRGLATAGTVLTLALLTTSVAAEVPRNAKYGDIEWRPTDAGRSFQEYKVAIGQGTLDLTALPVARGQRVTIDAGVTLGELSITVPHTARVILDAKIMFGDLRIDQRTTSGPNAKAAQVMEPEGTPVKNPPEIVLRIRGKLGDVEVTRV